MVAGVRGWCGGETVQGVVDERVGKVRGEGWEEMDAKTGGGTRHTAKFCPAAAAVGQTKLTKAQLEDTPVAVHSIRIAPHKYDHAVTVEGG